MEHLDQTSADRAVPSVDDHLLTTPGQYSSRDFAGSRGRSVTWGVREYFTFGALHFVLQLAVGVTWLLTFAGI